MIIFDLSCENGHRFEGWFASAADFEHQHAHGLVACPQCDSVDVSRVPSAVHIGSSTGASAPKRKPAGKPSSATAVDHPLALYHQLVSELLAQSEDTGTEFAKEARRIHYHEAPARAIHGQSSDSEVEALRSEGIEVWRLPVVEKEKLN